MTSPSQKNQWAELFDAARPLEERTALAFSADGPLARRQTNFTPREGQLAFAQAVAEAIQNKVTLLAEAGTRYTKLLPVPVSVLSRLMTLGFPGLK